MSDFLPGQQQQFKILKWKKQRRVNVMDLGARGRVGFRSLKER